MKRRRQTCDAVLRTALLAGCVITAVGGCAPPVKVTSHPVEMQIEHPKQFIDMGGNRRAEGLTEWFFHCRPKIDSDIKVDETGYLPVVTITVRAAQLEIGLTVKQQIPESAVPQLIEHEGGHVQIAKRIYAGAEAEAQKACRAIIGKRFTMQDRTKEAAIAAATEEAAHQLCKDYLSNTAAQADYISDAYDRLTLHAQMKTGTQQAIEDAFQHSSRYTTSVTVK